MEFSRKEYWNGLPFPSPGDLPDPGLEPASLTSLALQADSLLLSRTREDLLIIKSMLIKSTVRNPLHRPEWPPSERSPKSKCCRGCTEYGILLHSEWGCTRVQPRWKIVWRLLKKVNRGSMGSSNPTSELKSGEHHNLK